jgi:hypothetical protein
MIVVDTHPETQSGQALQKKAWDAPRVTQLQAGSAEFQVGGQTDNVDKS